MSSKKTKKYRDLRSKLTRMHAYDTSRRFFEESFGKVDCEHNTDAAMAFEPAQVTEPLIPLKIEELLEEQREDEFCQETRVRLANNPECQYFEDHRTLICRHAQKENAEQIILPKTLRRQALLRANYPRLACHSGGSRTYQTLRRTFCRPSMALDAYHTVRQS